MLTYPQLVTLERSLRGARVLSIYLAGGAHDPASRLVWRTDLERSLRDLRHRLVGSSHDERDEFEQSVALLETRLAPYAAGLSSPGWVGIIANGHVHAAERLPVAMPTMAVWSTGMCVAPYIRALRATRPVIVAIVDARAASMYRYRAGELESLGTIHAHATIAAASHMGDIPRSRFHSGVRGAMARDAVQRAHAAGTERMLRESEVTVATYAALDGCVVVGGNSWIARRFSAMLAQSVSERVIHVDHLTASATHGEIVSAAQSGASMLRDGADLRRIAEIIGIDAGHGSAALGPAGTRVALEQRSVRELYITGRYLAEHIAEAEDAIRRALDQGATVEQVSRDAAARLDEHGGIAARLRFPVPPVSVRGAAVSA